MTFPPIRKRLGKMIKMEGAINIPVWRLALAYLLFAVVFLIAWRKQLRLGRDLVISVFRMTIQLVLMGLALRVLFDIDSSMAEPLSRGFGSTPAYLR